MLASLLGSKTAENVLLYLFIHKESYVQELSKHFSLSSNGVQKQLKKFEEIGMIKAESKANTIYYSFNDAYIFYNEIYLMLQKLFKKFKKNDQKFYQHKNINTNKEAQKKYQTFLKKNMPNLNDAEISEVLNVEHKDIFKEPNMLYAGYLLKFHKNGLLKTINTIFSKEINISNVNINFLNKLSNELATYDQMALGIVSGKYEKLKEWLAFDIKKISTKERINIMKLKKTSNDLLNESLSKNLKLKYITGTSAFNIPYKDEMFDWHQEGMIHNNKFITNGDQIIGSEMIFGSYGLRDVKDFFKKMNIATKIIPFVCASPIRAILDILYDSVLKGVYPNSIEDMDRQFMMDSLNKSELSDRIDELILNVKNEYNVNNIEKWRKRNAV